MDLITDEIVETACAAWWDANHAEMAEWGRVHGLDPEPKWAELTDASQDATRGFTRSALEAAASLIAGRALREARDELLAAYKTGPGNSLQGNPETWRKGFAKAHRIVCDLYDRIEARS
jgi:hypothetical protein